MKRALLLTFLPPLLLATQVPLQDSKNLDSIKVTPTLKSFTKPILGTYIWGALPI